MPEAGGALRRDEEGAHVEGDWRRISSRSSGVEKRRCGVGRASGLAAWRTSRREDPFGVVVGGGGRGWF